MEKFSTITYIQIMLWCHMYNFFQINIAHDITYPTLEQNQWPER